MHRYICTYITHHSELLFVGYMKFGRADRSVGVLWAMFSVVKFGKADRWIEIIWTIVEFR